MCDLIMNGLVIDEFFPSFCWRLQYSSWKLLLLWFKRVLTGLPLTRSPLTRLSPAFYPVDVSQNLVDDFLDELGIHLGGRSF